MAWFEDLQPCTAFAGEWRNLLAIGWLEHGHEFSRRDAAPELEQLEFVGLLNSRFGWNPPGASRSERRCKLCRDTKWNEGGSFFIPGDDVLYVAPRMLGHYILEHRYEPPDAFVRAVRSCPAPFSRASEAAIERHFKRSLTAPEPHVSDVKLTPVDEVFVRPGMYIGGTDWRGLENVLLEVAGNSIDEFLAKRASRLAIDIDERGWVTVEDDGRGLPVEGVLPGNVSGLELIFTTLHWGATLDGHHPHVHVRDGGVGVGLGAVSAVSARLEVETRRSGFVYRAAFERGRMVEPPRREGATSQQGTRIRYLPDPKIFGDARHDLQALKIRFGEIARLCQTLELSFQGKSLQRPGGLPGWVLDLAPDRVKETCLSACGAIGGVEVEVALVWSPKRRRPRIVSFVNYVRTPRAGSHQTGIISAINSAAVRRARSAEKVVAGLVAVVHVGMLDPSFEGPTRALLHEEAARIAVHEVVTRAINEAPWWWDRLHTAIG